MFKEIFIEEDVRHHPITENILKKFPKVAITEIKKVEDIWGRTKKPYLQKRDNLNLFIGKKVGALVKEAPPAYGHGSEPHYYFIHAYNCIYECEYCYLQGYFNTPDIVLFVNHEDIIRDISLTLDKHPDTDVWFHAGEYSDSLSLSHVTQEWPLYWDFFKKNPRAKLEIRTKSVNIREIQKLEPLPNTYISFSLSPQDIAAEFDLKTPGTNVRLKAIKTLFDLGFQIGIHFDPVIYQDNFKETYEKLLNDLNESIPHDKISYMSVGVVRFTKDVHFEVEKNYPNSRLLQGEFIKSFDNKVRYNRPMRMWVLNTLKELCLQAGVLEDKLYLCMEEGDA